MAHHIDILKFSTQVTFWGCSHFFYTAWLLVSEGFLKTKNIRVCFFEVVWKYRALFCRNRKTL